jgi:hypothetical protein
MPKDRAHDPKRKFTGPSPIGMGALAGYGDFAREKQRQEHHKAEEAAFESGGMEAVNKYRKETGYSG